MYNTPIADFLTFTVRGSWRHGDSRGSWKRNGQFVAPDPNITAAPNKNLPHYFNEEERRIIESAMEEVCAERQWILHQKSVLSNHVHIVVTAPDILAENVMKLLKAKATMRLRKGGFVGEEEKIWTQLGSTKYLFDEEALQTVCEYVHVQPTKAGMEPVLRQNDGQ
ncbi:MAG: transposase [Planctomycetaceae bacterium]|nr:transposase [Planctomycetaceae bacterium]